MAISVREREDRGRALGAVEQLRGGEPARLDALARRRGDRDRGPVDARRLEPLAPAGEALALDVARRARLGIGGRWSRRRRTASTMPKRRWPSAVRCSAAERAAPRSSMLTRTGSARGVEVDAHERQPAGPHRVHPRIVLGHAVEDEAVDERGLDERRVAARRCAARARARARAPRSPAATPWRNADRGGVAECARERIVEHEPDRAGLAARQRAGDGIGPGVAELLRRPRTPARAARARAGRGGCTRSRRSCGTPRPPRRRWRA